MSLEALAKQVNPIIAVDVFDETLEIDKELIEQYYLTNERKKADEKWLKETKPAIERALKILNRDKVDVGSLRISMVVPDTSHFDMDKVLGFISKNNLAYLGCVKSVVDEKKLEEVVANGDIDLELLKEAAWVESKGTPRLTINKVKASE